MDVFERAFWNAFGKIGPNYLNEKSLHHLENILRHLDTPKDKYDDERERHNPQINDRIKEDFDDRFRNIAGNHKGDVDDVVNIINGGNPSTPFHCCPILLVKIKGDSKLSEKLTRAGQHIKSCERKTKAVVFVGTINYFTWLKLRWMFSDCFVILKPIDSHNQILLPRL